MKKLEDFKAEKIEIDSIYGGKMATGTMSCNTQTIGASTTTNPLPADGGGKDDGSDEEWDV
jgi:hypothetical protein